MGSMCEAAADGLPEGFEAGDDLGPHGLQFLVVQGEQQVIGSGNVADHVLAR